jgi:uncharacterized repeat protein (TIGR03847 family)
MEESRAKYELGGVLQVSPEALGQPGKRTFRILLQSTNASAALWLEKEQLSELALYLQQILASSTTNPSDVTQPELESSGVADKIDFKVGKMSLAHDTTHNTFLITAYDIEGPDEDRPIVSFWLTVRQGHDLAKDALRVCAGGRPYCYLCGRPIDPDGHVCPKANGHLELDQ